MALATALPVAPPASRTSTTPPSSRLARPRRPKLGPVGARHHPATPRASVRLTRRGLALCWIVAFACLGVTAFGMVNAFTPATPVVVGSTTVAVAPGQSLWMVAEKVNPGVDPRISVAAIREANGLSSTPVVQPGTRLSVPVYADRS